MFCSRCLPLSPETLTQNIETILKLYNTVFFIILIGQTIYFIDYVHFYKMNYSSIEPRGFSSIVMSKLPSMPSMFKFSVRKSR